MIAAELARAARALVGTPFRLHGRDPQAGLDCVGVLEAAIRACGCDVRLPNLYALRSCRQPDLAPFASELGLLPIERPDRPGDVLLLQPGPFQHHLAIITAPSIIVHAHAGLRRVVEGPIPAYWPVIACWRL
jgi:cell wall-associated NlpC family hydrolase